MNRRGFCKSLAMAPVVAVVGMGAARDGLLIHTGNPAGFIAGRYGSTLKEHMLRPYQHDAITGIWKGLAPYTEPDLIVVSRHARDAFRKVTS